MGKVYVLREPRKKDWNIYALREAARLKKWFIGTYYSPRLKRLLIAFKPTPGTHVNRLVFEEMNESLLRESYQMVCPPGCGRCCVAKSGAFMLDIEVTKLPPELQLKLEAQPKERILTPGGVVTIYYIGTGPGGRCIFYNAQQRRCMLEAQYGKEAKPIICLIEYCTVFAERNGKKYLKTGYKVTDNGVLMFYRSVGGDEWKAAIRRMARLTERIAKAERRRRKEQQEAQEPRI
ncbi:hypothetical protein Pyrfu_1784 [Pyrolobus fumarii 1A]|uniref:Uncharacterized protein n=1 Tax=Pyrolobus fumarii (strain DSM 11204 / 1A) TaxID=694429 RepID=G0ECR8_PYRF1|nr:hypothetical protein [Pyrolobus fumarii]AEM39638.1 hypothetical protein Pyrfu_1784 [Pyrolobus fumarii 1A]